MSWIWYVLMFVILVCGLFINLLGLPGLWLMLLAAFFYAWLTGWIYLTLNTLLVLLGLVMLAEILELVASTWTAGRVGGSKRGMLGGIAGGLLGGIFLSFIPIPVVGTIVGVLLGTFLGTVGIELLVQDDAKTSLQIGKAATLGRLLGTMGKTMLGIAVLLIAMIVGLPW